VFKILLIGLRYGLKYPIHLVGIGNLKRCISQVSRGQEQEQHFEVKWNCDSQVMYWLSLMQRNCLCNAEHVTFTHACNHWPTKRE